MRRKYTLNAKRKTHAAHPPPTAYNYKLTGRAHAIPPAFRYNCPSKSAIVQRNTFSRDTYAYTSH